MTTMRIIIIAVVLTLSVALPTVAQRRTPYPQPPRGALGSPERPLGPGQRYPAEWYATAAPAQADVHATAQPPQQQRRNVAERR
jgi:hypothetical protein